MNEIKLIISTGVILRVSLKDELVISSFISKTEGH